LDEIRRTDVDPLGDIRVAVGQGQPLGDARFLDSIEKAMVHRREARLRGRPKKAMAQEAGKGEHKQVSMES